jgi:hypothetical protein
VLLTTTRRPRLSLLQATGDLNPETTRDFLIFEAKMAFALVSVLFGGVALVYGTAPM